jgi:DNA-binding transcriptional ArsR family regulator
MDKKIVDILKESNSKGISITELVSKSKLPRSNVRISLAKLEGANRVSIRKVGMAKLYHLKKETEK